MTADWMHRMTRELVAARSAGDAQITREAVRRSLRPRLRWAVDHPRALAALKRCGLWTPPTLNYCDGRIVRVTRGVAYAPWTYALTSTVLDAIDVGTHTIRLRAATPEYLACSPLDELVFRPTAAAAAAAQPTPTDGTASIFGLPIRERDDVFSGSASLIASDGDHILIELERLDPQEHRPA